MGCSCSQFARFIREFVFQQQRYHEVVDSPHRWTPAGDVEQVAYSLPAVVSVTASESFPLRKTMSKDILTAKTGFFAEYRLCDELGSGSTSTVYRCVRKKDEVSFACKVIEKQPVKGEAYAHLLQQFAEEVKVLGLLHHPNIIHLVDSFESADRIYVVTELMRGGELFDFVVDRGTLNEEDASTIVRSICSAVAYMHSQNVIHRDIKMENLLLVNKEVENQRFDFSKVKIIDFGLSKLMPDGSGPTASFLGTKGYIAPEMLQRCKYGKSVDVWACGVIVFVLLCGCLPFGNGNDPIENTQSAAQEKFSLRFPTWASNLSDSAKDLLRKLLDVNPKTRITAEEAMSHPWVVGSTVAPRNALLSAKEMGSQRDLLRQSPQALLDAVRRDVRDHEAKAAAKPAQYGFHRKHSE